MTCRGRVVDVSWTCRGRDAADLGCSRLLPAALGCSRLLSASSRCSRAPEPEVTSVSRSERALRKWKLAPQCIDSVKTEPSPSKSVAVPSPWWTSRSTPRAARPRACAPHTGWRGGHPLLDAAGLAHLSHLSWAAAPSATTTTPILWRPPVSPNEVLLQLSINTLYALCLCTPAECIYSTVT